MKKVLLVMSLLFCSLVMFSGNTKAAEKTSGNYSYEVLDEQNKTAAITHVDNVSATVKIPKKIKGYTVVQIGGANCIFTEEDVEKVEQINLPDTLRKIGAKAFKGCKNLKKIDFPKELRYIGARAMEKCCKIKKVVLPKKLKSIGNRAFYYCEAMEKAVFKTNKAKIGTYAFATWPVTEGGKSHLKEIDLPLTYKGKIMDLAFAGYCGKTFTWGNLTAENGAFFRGVKSLEKIKIHKKAKKVDIPRNCLSACAEQLEIVVPKNVKSVYIWQQTYNIKQVTIQGMDTVLEGDYAMGVGDEHIMITVEKVKCKKNSMAWAMASQYIRPDFSNADWEAISDNMYTEKNIDTKPVKLVKIPSNEVSAAKKDSLSSKIITVTKGKSETLKVMKTKKKVKWKILSGKKYITMKKKGKKAVTIKGKKEGKAKIQAAVGKKKLNCKVFVITNVPDDDDTDKNAEDVAALKKIIAEQRERGATVSNNINSHQYRWENGRLTGIIWYFENLSGELDISNLTALKRLSCSHNKLTSLNVSNNTALELLYCSGNQLTSLDVSNATALKDLDCSGNKLTSLDVSNNTKLVESRLECDSTVTVIR